MALSNNSETSARLPALADQVRERVYGWRRKLATVAVGALALMMAYGVVFGHNGVTMFLHKRQEANSLQQQMKTLQLENQELRGRDERLQNDPGAIEHQAREELHYTRPGEVIVTLPPERNATTTQSAE